MEIEIDKVLDIIIEKNEEKYKSYLKERLYDKEGLSAKDVLYYNHIIGVKLGEKISHMNILERLLIVNFANKMSLWYLENYEDVFKSHVIEAKLHDDADIMYEETVKAIEETGKELDSAIEFTLINQTEGSA